MGSACIHVRGCAVLFYGGVAWTAKRPGFYGEPRHLTGLPPSSSEIFNSGRFTSPRKRSASPRVPFHRRATILLCPFEIFQFVVPSVICVECEEHSTRAYVSWDMIQSLGIKFVGVIYRKNSRNNIIHEYSFLANLSIYLLISVSLCSFIQVRKECFFFWQKVNHCSLQFLI